MQSYVGASSRLLQPVSTRRLRSRCHAEGLPSLLSLSELSSIQPGVLLAVSDTDLASAVTSSVDAIADAVSGSGVDAAAASAIPVELLALGAVGLGTPVVIAPLLTETQANLVFHAAQAMRSFVSCPAASWEDSTRFFEANSFCGPCACPRPDAHVQAFEKSQYPGLEHSMHTAEHSHAC